ncbi:MAG: hypothetical protein LBQ64_06035 [Bacteroidales bacterium]|jgi:hypothetical protein|nr:hypothetical protein [Bacteroidales bacterium]
MANLLRFKQGKTGVFILVFVFLGLHFLENNLYGQSNRGGRKNTFSSLGKGHSYIRQGLTIHVGAGISANLKQAISAVPMAGIGYVASQYYGIGNRFMQQSVTYQFGLGMDHGGYQTHNLIGTFHCSYIGKLDMNPFVYGLAMHFAYATKNEVSTAYANFYIRPEVGIAFPAQYADRTKSLQRVTAMITYGFNIRTFYNYNPEMEEYIGKTDPLLPFTAMNHHVVTLRLNINFSNIREMRR